MNFPTFDSPSRNSKKKLISFFCSLFLITSFHTSAAEIPFEKGTFKDALKSAKKAHKMIFVDAYTTWCGPCKWMAKNVFTNEEVAKYYGSTFICIKLDMEAGEGKEFAKTYDVHVYPTYLFLDENGGKIHQACGSKEAADFIQDGKNALDPKTQLTNLKKKFEGGDQDFDFLKRYAKSLMAANMKGDDVMRAMVDSKDAEQLLNEADFSLLASSSSLGSPAFNFILKYKEKYHDIIGKEKLDDFVADAFANEARHAAKSKNPDESLKVAIESVNKYTIENSKEMILLMNWKFAQVIKKGLYEAAEPYINNFKTKDANELNNAAWTIFENYTETEKLDAAAKWAQLSVELKPDFANLDTYANLLHKLGRNEEAAKYAQLAIEKGKNAEQDVTDTEKLLKQIETTQK